VVGNKNRYDKTLNTMSRGLNLNVTVNWKKKSIHLLERLWATHNRHIEHHNPSKILAEKFSSRLTSYNKLNKV